MPNHRLFQFRLDPDQERILTEFIGMGRLDAVKLKWNMLHMAEYIKVHMEVDKMPEILPKRKHE